MSKFDDFYEAVRRTWPRYQTTMEEVHVPWIACCHDREPSEVAMAFKLCKQEYPDANKPNWERIISWLERDRRSRREARERLEEHRYVLQWRREQRERLERKGDPFRST